jgi:hypothetical protein
MSLQLSRKLLTSNHTSTRPNFYRRENMSSKGELDDWSDAEGIQAFW